MTPETAQTILNEWRQSNLEYMEKNERELPTLLGKQNTLQTELDELKEQEKKLTTEVPSPEGNFRGELDDLNRRLIQLEKNTIPGLQKFSSKFGDVEFDMKLHIAAVLSAEKVTARGMELVLKLKNIKMPTKDIDEAKSITEKVKTDTAELIKANRTHTNAANNASDSYNKICDYASRLSSQPPPPADEIAAWKVESDDLMAKTLRSLRTEADNAVGKFLNLNLETNNLKQVLAALEAFLVRKGELINDYEELKKIRAKLVEAEKDITGANERLADLKAIVASAKSLLSESVIYDEISNLRSRIKKLIEISSGKHKQYEEEAVRMQGRISAAERNVERAWEILSTALPRTPELGRESRELLDILRNSNTGPVSEEIFEKLDSAISEGRRALSGTEKPLSESERLTSIRIPAILKKGGRCLEEITMASTQTETGDTNRPPTIRDLENAKNSILPYGESLKAANAKLTAAEVLCDSISDFIASMEGQVDKIEKAEKMVDGTIRSAIALAAKCPDVNNPENIKILYEQAEQLAGKIGADIVLLIGDRSKVREKIAESESLRSEAIGEAEAAMKEINTLYNSTQPIANRLSPIGTSYWSDIVSIQKEAQTLYNGIKGSSQCNVKSPDSLVARAENAYAGALIFIGANSNLLELAEQCKLMVKEQKNLDGDIEAALNSCDFRKARDLIDQLQPGTKRTEFEQRYQDSIGLEKRIDNLINQAKDKYEEHSYQAALSILNGALSEAECDRHIQNINDEIAKVEAKMGPTPVDPVDIDKPDEDDIMTVNYEMLKIDKYCSFAALWGKDLKESETYWALFEIPKTKDDIAFLSIGIEANKYIQYLIIHFDKEDRKKRLKRNDPPPHIGYANAYRSSNKAEIRVVATAETRTEIERLREQQRSPGDKEILEQGEKRLEKLLKTIEDKMRSEGKLESFPDTDRSLFENSEWQSGIPSLIEEVFKRFVQDIQSGKLVINILKNGVIVDTVEIK
ncbi:hypothetical protein ACFLT9_08560 [Acidobacteriota bacterium]